MNAESLFALGVNEYVDAVVRVCMPAIGQQTVLW